MASAQASLLRKPDRPHHRGYPEGHLRVPEPRAVAREHEVAPRRQGEPVAEAVTVHCCDDRLVDLPATLERVEGGLLPEAPGELTGCATAVAKVGPGAERASGTGHDGDPGVLVVPEPGEGVVQVATHLAVDRVHDLGPVVGDGDDVIGAVVENCAVARSCGVVRQGQPCRHGTRAATLAGCPTTGSARSTSIASTKRICPPASQSARRSSLRPTHDRSAQ